LIGFLRLSSGYKPMNTERHASFDRIASRYDATRVLPPAQQHQIARGIMAAVRGGMGTRFVEPGVGTGRIALPLLRAGADYVGTDIAPAMLDRFREKLQAEPWLAGRVKLFEADAMTLPIPDSSVDVAITAHLLHLVPNWRDALDEIRRVVRPYGYYVHASDDAGVVHTAFGAEWTRLAAQRGLDGMPNRPPALSEILTHLGLPDSALTRITLARWAAPTRIEDALRRFRDREASQVWALDESDHLALMGQLQAWAISTYGSTDAVADANASFHIAVIRFDA
jgi:ubiquinone/menaquinone biosynthesis C-methylase UbiE